MTQKKKYNRSSNAAQVGPRAAYTRSLGSNRKKTTAEKNRFRAAVRVLYMGTTYCVLPCAIAFRKYVCVLSFLLSFFLHCTRSVFTIRTVRWPLLALLMHFYSRSRPTSGVPGVRLALPIRSMENGVFGQFGTVFGTGLAFCSAPTYYILAPVLETRSRRCLCRNVSFFCLFLSFLLSSLRALRLRTADRRAGIQIRSR